jgi:AraC-like DNA-binding protein
MHDELWQALIQITASVNALLLGAVLFLSPRMHRTRARQKLGAALLAYGYLLLSFTAKDNLWLPVTGAFLLSDYVVALLASALFLDYMTGSVGRGSVSRLIYLPAPLFLAGAALAGNDFILGPAINVVVVLQFTYTCLTTWRFTRDGRSLTSRPRHLLVLLAGLWILHVLQFSRMLLPGVGWLFDIVPLAGAAVFLTFTVLVLTDSRALRALSQTGIPRQPAEDILATLENYVLEEKPYLDSRLTLDQLASAIDVPARVLSQAFGASEDENFYGFVNRHRVAEARKLLVSPRESRTSVEAIGLMSGFRSRSTFYEAFRREVAMTPAEFRRQNASSGAVSD